LQDIGVCSMFCRRTTHTIQIWKKAVMFIYKSCMICWWLYLPKKTNTSKWVLQIPAHILFVSIIHSLNLGLCRVPGALPSTFCRTLGKEFFVKCRTQQSSALGNDGVCREQDSRQRNTLGKGFFAQCQTLGEGWLSAKDRQPPSKADGRYLFRESCSGTRQRITPIRHSVEQTLPSAIPEHSAKYIFIFFFLPTKLFVVWSYTM
jgi:hypothetical protein